MCGIAGIFDFDGRPIDRDLLVRMRDALHHRGPDEAGLHVEAGVGLGHRRLSIIDLSSGQQPLTNEDGSVIVVYNGEIYNFEALTSELEAAGHTFRTRCDTEVLVHAWEEWGERCVERFRGMFAFALWDRNQRRLFMARDRIGIKPLYYGRTRDGRMLFGSELKALLACPDLPREIEPQAVEDYFAYGYVPEPRTILASAFKLPPGHRILFRPGAPWPTSECYWDVPFVEVAVASEQAAEDELIERLREAVEMRLVSEVPLGAFLSGGVDSSAVVAMMAGASSEPVNTCSISFADPAYDESRWARQVAERYGTRHHVEQVNPDDFSLVDELAALYDEPYSDSSAMPTYRVCELARKRVTVALSGDGGDENFAGYRRHKWHANEEAVRGRIPAPLRRGVFGPLGRFYPKADWAPKVLRAKTTFQALARDSVDAYFHSISCVPDTVRAKLWSKGFARNLQGYNAVEVFRRHAKNAPEHPLSRVQYLDFKTYLPGDILTKVDRASMAHSLEVRVPILEHQFVEWISGLPPEYKLRRGEGKYLLKRALRPYLSDDTLYRKKKGFAVPLPAWFRGPLKERVRAVVTGPTLESSGIFDPAMLARVIDHHERGLRDYSTVIWSLLMFDGFLRQSLGETRPNLASATGAGLC